MDFTYVVVPVLIVLGGSLIAGLSIHRLVRFRTRSHPTWRKVIERTSLFLLTGITLLLVLNTGFNAVMLYKTRHPAPGSLYMVNGHQMRIECTGAGSPVLILDTGGGGDGLDWGVVQPALSKTTRVCSYDRAGMGWSDELPPPRDAVHVADELSGLLQAAGIDGFIVLMGHSRGGMFVREYASRYPAQVAGLILVDSHVPLMQLDPIVRAHDVKTERDSRWQVIAERAALIFGIPRLFGMCSGPIRGYDARTAELLAADRCHQPYHAINVESDSLLQSDQEVASNGPYGRLPVLILSSDSAFQAAHGMPLDLLKRGDEMQEDLKKLSTRSRRIIARGSGHMVPQSRPELVEKEVSLFIKQIRGEAPAPTQYGTTVTK
jgi:pimeloyl-ACP methyl ester carboxylesterase